MNEKMTEAVRTALGNAANMAMNLSQQVIDVPHVLYSALEDSSGIFYRVLMKLNKPVDAVMNELNNRINMKPSVNHVSENDLRMSYDLNNLLGEANKIMSSYGDEYLSIEHIILALFHTNSTDIKSLIQQFGLNKKEVEKVIKDMRGGQKVDSPNPENNYEVLEKYGRDLIKDVKEGKLDPVIGRDEEIRRVIQILSRKTKNNPILIGEPGVGKTAIVEGLAWRIFKNDVPETLAGKTLFS